MSALINMPRAAWRRQPSGLLKINFSNPYSNQLYACVVFDKNEPFDLVTNSTLQKTGSGSVTRANTTQGVGLLFGDASGSTYYSMPITGTLVTRVQSILWVGRSPSGIVLRDWTVTLGSIPIWRNGSQIDVRFGGTDYTAAGVWNSDSMDKKILALNSVNGLQLYDETGLVMSNAASNSDGLISPYVLHRNGNTNQGVAATSVLLVIWAKILNGPDILQNPWQLFTPAPSRFYLIPSSGGATTHDVALTLAYFSAFDSAATAQFNAGITLATLAGTLSGKTAQFNSALSLDTTVSLTLARALSTLAAVQLDMTADQSVSALNDAVAAITESITCSYTSSVTANLLASLSFGITQSLISGTGGQLAAAIVLALNAGTQASATAVYMADVSLLTTLQTALQSALATTASLTLPASLTITLAGERLTDGDVSLALAMQAGVTTSATAILGAQLTLATHLLMTPSGVAAFQTALSLANTLATSFTTGNTIQSALSLAVALSLAEAATVSLDGALSLGVVLHQVQSAVASLTAATTFPVALTAPITGNLAMDAGISLGWTLSMTSDGAYFEITVTLPTGRIVVITASERLVQISASERLITQDPL